MENTCTNLVISEIRLICNVQSVIYRDYSIHNYGRWKSQLGANPNHPVNIPCGRKSEYPRRKPMTNARALTHSFHMDVLSSEQELNYDLGMFGLCAYIPQTMQITCFSQLCLMCEPTVRTLQRVSTNCAVRKCPLNRKFRTICHNFMLVWIVWGFLTLQNYSEK